MPPKRRNNAMRNLRNFQQRLSREPQLLVSNAYINFLREFKAAHPRYSFRQLLQRGCNAWLRSRGYNNKAYKKKATLKRIQKGKGVRLPIYKKRFQPRIQKKNKRNVAKSD